MAESCFKFEHFKIWTFRHLRFTMTCVNGGGCKHVNYQVNTWLLRSFISLSWSKYPSIPTFKSLNVPPKTRRCGGRASPIGDTHFSIHVWIPISLYIMYIYYKIRSVSKYRCPSWTLSIQRFKSSNVPLMTRRCDGRASPIGDRARWRQRSWWESHHPPPPIWQSQEEIIISRVYYMLDH